MPHTDMQEFYDAAAGQADFLEAIADGVGEALQHHETSQVFVTWWLLWYGPPSWYATTEHTRQRYWVLCATAYAAWSAAQARGYPAEHADDSVRMA